MMDSKHTNISKLSNYTFKFTLFLGWVTGCYSTTLPPLNPTKPPKTYSILSTLWILFLYFVNLSMFIDFFLVISTSNSSPVNNSLSEFIVLNSFQISLFAKDLLRRGFSIFHQRRLFSLLQILHGFNTSKISSTEQNYGNKEPESLNRLVYATILTTTIGISKVIRLSALLFFTPIFQAVLIPNLEISRYIFFILILSAFGSAASTKNLIPLIGGQLATHFENIVHEFISYSKESQCKQNYMKKDFQAMQASVPAGDNFYEEFNEKFKRIRKGFKLYNRIVNAQILLTTISSTILTAWFVHRLVRSTRSAATSPLWAILLGLGYFQEVLNFVIFGHTGEVIKQKIASIKKDVRNLCFELCWTRKVSSNNSAIFENDKRILISNEIVNWNWSLTAFGLFKLDHRIYFEIGGAILSLVIFIFELSMTEEAAGLIRELKNATVAV